MRTQVSGQITTWLIDADQQLFSNYLLDLLKEKIRFAKRKINLSEAFSLLTTPDKPSFVGLESRDSLVLVKSLAKDAKTKKIFLDNDAAALKNKVSEIRPDLQQKIKRHYQKYLWQYYNYEGPILELDYFLEVWRGLLKQNKIDKLRQESGNKYKQARTRRLKLFKVLALTKKEKQLFNAAQNIVWLKSWRKDLMYFGSYVLDKIAAEIGRRLGLSLKQVRFFCHWEIKDALLKNQYNPDALNERYRFSVIYTDSVHRPSVYSGKKARSGDWPASCIDIAFLLFYY